MRERTKGLNGTNITIGATSLKSSSVGEILLMLKNICGPVLTCNFVLLLRLRVPMMIGARHFSSKLIEDLLSL